MSKVLAVNCGSSSLKFQLFEMDTESVITSGIIERIGMEDSIFTIKYNGTKDKKVFAVPTHKEAVQVLLDTLIEKKIVERLDEIKGIGHRVVQGGPYFDSSCVVDDDVIAKIDELSPLAPLHNPAHIIGIKAFKEAIPTAGAVVVFDTAFHQTMPEKAYLYGLPYEYYEKYAVRRYGFHGTSHKYVSLRAAEILGKKPEDLKIVVCHLGNGSSISAVDGGKCVDTSMGLTPLEGLIMGTRSGDLDPAILEFLCNHENLTISEMLNILNKKSGVLGMSGGISSDFRDLNAAANDGNEIAKVTLEAYAYRVAKYIGAYTAAMNGVDAITFTAGVGENAAWLRPMVAKYLGYLGVELDEAASEKACGVEGIISTPESKVKLCVIPTNEELAIARETLALVK